MIAIAILVAAAAAMNIYNIRVEYGGYVLWNASEAYLFVGVTREGLPVSYLRYPWFFVTGYLSAPESPVDERGSLVVIRVTSSGVEHHGLKLKDRGPGSGPSEFTPFEGRIYANYPALGGLCRWAGDHFEQPTQEERQRFDGINRLSYGEIDKGENGWSKRGFGTGPGDYKITADVGGRFGLAVTNKGVTGTGSGTVSIDLLHTGKAPERIWEFDGGARRVSKTEYQHAFQSRE